MHTGQARTRLGPAFLLSLTWIGDLQYGSGSAAPNCVRAFGQRNTVREWESGCKANCEQRYLIFVVAEGQIHGQAWGWNGHVHVKGKQHAGALHIY